MLSPVQAPSAPQAGPPGADLPASGASATTLTPEATAQVLAEVLATVLKRDDIPHDAHFFTSLGADSLLMAQFCARIRKRGDVPSVSMKEIYANPTIAELSALKSATETEPEPPSPVAASVPADPAVTTAAAWEYYLCGTLQLLTFFGYVLLTSWVGLLGYRWINEVSTLPELYLRTVTIGAAVFLGTCLLPIVGKWLIIGRWRPREIRIWSLGYFRFWLVKTMLRTSPLVLFAGSPLFVWYLRALGARIGRNTTLLIRQIPVCTDLLTIGEGTLVRKDAVFTCYRAHAGLIQTGPVTLGRDVLVSEATVIDINTSMGDGSQLGHRSTLYSGQSVPAGERWHGSPAQPTTVDYRTAEPLPVNRLRRLTFSLGQLTSYLFLIVPSGIGVLLVALAVPGVAALLESNPHSLFDWDFYLHALAISVVVYLGANLLRALVILTVPRLLSLGLTPGKTYPLYGVRHSLLRTISRLTNNVFYLTMFGDSSAIVYYLKAIGYDLSKIEQTGSNFGSAVRHETPFLATVGTGTMVADGLSFANAEYSSTSFRVVRTSVGARNFLGNHILYPAAGKTGENCLLGTKVMVPIDGPVREGVGLLGSPSFEIPRTVERDRTFDDLAHGDGLRPLLAAKNRHNLGTVLLWLLKGWIAILLTSVISLVGLEFTDVIGGFSLAVAMALSLVVLVVYSVLVERASYGFGQLKPRFCSIYHPHFWRHERFWKLVTNARLASMCIGTPFMGLIWRLRGVHGAARLFDDGCGIVEPTLVTLGKNCTLNAGSHIQSHSQEDGTFKSDYDVLGDGVTVGVGAMVHYGVTIGDRAVIGADSFLMKGEVVPQDALWGGNPAREIPRALPAPTPTPELTQQPAPEFMLLPAPETPAPEILQRVFIPSEGTAR